MGRGTPGAGGVGWGRGQLGQHRRPFEGGPKWGGGCITLPPAPVECLLVIAGGCMQGLLDRAGGPSGLSPVQRPRASLP